MESTPCIEQKATLRIILRELVIIFRQRSNTFSVQLHIEHEILVKVIVEEFSLLAVVLLHLFELT